MKENFSVQREYLNHGSEDEMEIEGYKKSSIKSFFTWIGFIVSLGLLRLVYHWWPVLMLYSMNDLCPLNQATQVKITETYGNQKYKRYHVKRVFSHDVGHLTTLPLPNGHFREISMMRYFYCKKLRYIWNEKIQLFEKLEGLEKVNGQLLHAHSPGLSEIEQMNRRNLFGDNEIKVEVMGVVQLLFLEVLNPFYVFQVFSVTLWYNDYYYYYATAIIIMSIAGVASTVYQTRQNQNRLSNTVRFSDIVSIRRSSGLIEQVGSEALVPGDVVVIPSHGCQLSFDAVLLTGNCVVNESMLTGESVPVTKTPMPDSSSLEYNMKEHSRHTLFCGTKILQTRYYGHEHVFAVVIRTGFMTAKGNLVRSIMYPPPVDHQFERDSYKFIGFMAGIATIGFFVSIWWKIDQGEGIRAIAVQSLDLITIIIPPALPAAMTAGRIYALRRLQRKGLYCISPRSLTVIGSIDCVCFDKTGTLTEEGLDVWGVVPVINNILGQPLRQQEQMKNLPNDIQTAMATCHSLTRIEEELVGDPLDLKMFEWSGWSLEEPEVAENEKFDMIVPAVASSEKQENGKKIEVGIIRQFPFSSALQRMSVVTRTLGADEFSVYIKGSPEIVTSVCAPSTIPPGFQEALSTYTAQGFRVIGLAQGNVSMTYTKVQRVQREELEKDLVFLGLLVLDNRLKPESGEEIELLKSANIRTIMVTGDNIQTSVAVALDCGMLSPNEPSLMIDVDPGNVSRVSIKSLRAKSQKPASKLASHKVSLSIDYLYDVDDTAGVFAITGKALEIIKISDETLLNKILVRGRVFARMSPDQKQWLVEHLQALGYVVAMVGDGANDCGALKAAHAGVSLSESEASVASPFTYSEKNISCVSMLIREGRAALVTSFGIFKYMMFCSFTQFISVCVLYIVSGNVSDPQFLYMDLFVASNFALFFGYTKPFKGILVRDPPASSLVSLAPIVSVVLHMFNTLFFQSFAFWLVQQQEWFEPFEATDDEGNVRGYENTVVFTIAILQYIYMSVIFSRGGPYRSPIYTNYRMIASLLLISGFTIYLITNPITWLGDIFQMKTPPNEFQGIMWALIGGSFIIALTIEELIVHRGIQTKVCISRRRNKLTGFQKIEMNLRREDFILTEASDELI